MRNLFIIGLLLLGAFMAGWFKVNRDGERTTIEINRNEIRSDASKAIEKGREFLNEHERTTSWLDPSQPQEGTVQQTGVASHAWDQQVIQSGYEGQLQPSVQPSGQPSGQFAPNYQVPDFHQGYQYQAPGQHY